MCDDRAMSNSEPFIYVPMASGERLWNPKNE